jgi:hypothetical protein
MPPILDTFGRKAVIGVATGLAAVLLLAAAAAGLYLATARDPRPTGNGMGSTAPPSLDPYRGLASWVDLYDTRAWSDPAAAVRDMASHGVRTIFIQTANYSSTSGIVHPEALRTFIVEAHARHMYVVAWYLPDLKPTAKDYGRVAEATDFSAGFGQSFDSFALDIEATVVKSETQRNTALTALTDLIRAHVGRGYALGAIIPPPLAISKQKGYWNAFPFAMLAKSYDVFLPMHYYTYDIHTAATTYTSTLANMKFLRAQPGCAKIPVHMIGGISEKSSTAQVQAFVRAVGETGCIGASMYGWAGTSAKEWQALDVVKASGP